MAMVPFLLKSFIKALAKEKMLKNCFELCRQLTQMETELSTTQVSI